MSNGTRRHAARATTVFGSYGELDIDMHGNILAVRVGGDAFADGQDIWEYADILCFDVEEHVREYGWLDADTDIADIGFWAPRRGVGPDVFEIEYCAADAGFRDLFRRSDPAFYRNGAGDRYAHLHVPPARRRAGIL